MKTIEVSLDEYIGKKVHDLRMERRMGQGVLARVLSISIMQMSYLERGKRSWKISQLDIVSKFLGEKISYFID